MISIGVHEGLRTRAAKLAAAAAQLKRQSRFPHAPFSLAFLTDRRRVADPELILRALPAGVAVIYRDYDDARRAAAGARLRSIARSRGLKFIVAGDAALARALNADGLHLPSRSLRRPPAWAGFLTASCHSAPELRQAAAAGVGLVFLSPAFATQSHPGTEHLGPARFRRLAEQSSAPVLALGGVEAANARLRAGPPVAGLAAIGAGRA
jgi:thiamine monophosphate synthase